MQLATLFGDTGIVKRAATGAPSGVVARVTLATIVVAPEPLTRYAAASAVEERFGGPNGVLRTKHSGAYAQVPLLRQAGLIRVVGEVPTQGGEPTELWAATSAGVEEWRSWLASPITMPDAMTVAMTRLKAARPNDYTTMLNIIDRFEALLQLMVHQAVDPRGREGVTDRIALLWNKRQLVAQLQWCQHSRDVIHEEMGGGRP